MEPIVSFCQSCAIRRTVTVTGPLAACSRLPVLTARAHAIVTLPGMMAVFVQAGSALMICVTVTGHWSWDPNANVLALKVILLALVPISSSNVKTPHRQSLRTPGTPARPSARPKVFSQLTGEPVARTQTAHPITTGATVTPETPQTKMLRQKWDAQSAACASILRPLAASCRALMMPVTVTGH